MRRLLLSWVTICLVAIGLLYAANRQSDQQQAAARQTFSDAARASARSDVQKLNVSLRSIYENIRTLASLPSVRNIERHGQNLGSEARVTFQQIYNNLASNVAVSEVYIVPIDLAPDQTDSLTGKPEEPILMFDELIINGGTGKPTAYSTKAGLAAYSGPKEIEIYEYHQLQDHAAWLKKNYPTTTSFSGLNVPFVSGPEVITCDNTKFIKTFSDADRSGIMFSVPFYDPNGNIKGLITAIILTSALRDLLPSPHFALVNSGNHYAVLAAGAQALSASRDWIVAGKPDPGLVYSEVIPVPVRDSRSPWSIWSGLPNDAFLASPALASINRTRQSTFSTIVIIAFALGLCMSLMLKSLDQTRSHNKILRQARDTARKSETEAHDAAATFKSMNEDITVLNMQLTQKAAELEAAQKEIVRKAKMAQLGVLVSTVAHELRNPLSVVRTTAFVLQRKLIGASVDAKEHLGRIDSGIKRCDTIISQLLDFTRAQDAVTTPTDLDSWLENLLASECEKLSPVIEITCSLGLQGHMVDIDPERMRRVVINLLHNAAEAMCPKGTTCPEMEGRTPRIDVSTSKNMRGAEMAFTDNGPGIHPHFIEKIREPLFTTKGFGTGLGIPAAEKIIELHGGGLDISSTLGQGAVFTLWIPLQQQKRVA